MSDLDFTWLTPPVDRVATFEHLTGEDWQVVHRAFSAGLRGEPEPARRLGIDLAPKSVNKFAAAEGIASTDQARWLLFMRQTEKAVSEFEQEG